MAADRKRKRTTSANRPRSSRNTRSGGSFRVPTARVGSPLVRHRLLLALIMAAVMALSGRLIWVQGLDASARAEEAIEQRTVTRTIPALRGDIMDRNGTVLASSVERYDLWVNQLQVGTYLENSKKAEVKGVPAAAQKLAPVLGWSVAETEEALTGDRGFMYLSKNVDPAVRDAALALRIPGIGADRIAQRIYPAGSVGGNVLGFVGSDGVALAGTEYTYDEQLRGTDGRTQYERGAQGQIIPTGRQETTPAVDGKDLALTIDRDLQWKAQQVAASAAETWGATGASAVVLNSRTGEVLALADYPSYDPNAPGDAPEENRGNRSISNIFEPGSTGKVFTFAAALEEGTVSLDSQYEVPYTTTVEGHRIKDARPHPDQQLTLAGVLKNSSNVGTVQVSETLTPQVRYEYLKAFGLGEPTGVGLPGESAGIVHPASEWAGRTRYTTSFGQGYSVNALQMTSAVGTFANDGVRVQPRIVAGTREEDGSIRPLGEPESTRVVSSETADAMNSLMDNAVEDGVSGASVPGYAVAGKTGTAQVPDGTYTASFIGYAPADDPEIVIGVFVFGLNSFISGGKAAAPAFSELMTFTLQHQGIPPTGKPARELENEWGATE